MSSSSSAPALAAAGLAGCTWDSPVGPLHIAAGEHGLRMVIFGEEDVQRLAARARPSDVPGSRGEDGQPPADRARAIAEQTKAQLEEYFAGRRRSFSVPIDLRGTDFQRRVWDELCRIDYGTTVSYGELAARIGRPSAVRAVGAANGANPISIIVPCHRVIGAAGSLTGYGGGLSIKRYLLELEQSVAGGRLL